MNCKPLVCVLEEIITVINARLPRLLRRLAMTVGVTVCCFKRLPRLLRKLAMTVGVPVCCSERLPRLLRRLAMTAKQKNRRENSSVLRFNSAKNYSATTSAAG